MEKGELFNPVLGMEISAATMENSIEFPQKAKIQKFDPAIPFLVISPDEENENTNLKRYTYPNVHTSINRYFPWILNTYIVWIVLGA